MISLTSSTSLPMPFDSTVSRSSFRFVRVLSTVGHAYGHTSTVPGKFLGKVLHDFRGYCHLPQLTPPQIPLIGVYAVQLTGSVE